MLENRTDDLASRTPPTIPDPTRPRRKNTLRRADLAPGDCLCNHCAGKCCRYFSLPIETPTRWDDFDTIHGYLAHGRTLVYVEKGTWYLVVMTRCRYLTEDDRCQVYYSRPKICQDYTTDDCEYDEDWIFEKVFETAEQFRDYAEAVLPARRRPARNGPTSLRLFSLPIETPTGWDDYDAIRWYLAHGSTLVYVEKGTWYLVVMTRCQHLSEDDRRFLLARRSGIRGDGPTIGLEVTDHPDWSFEKVFETPEHLWEYAEAVLPPRKRPKPPGPTFTVISTPPTP